MVIHLTGAMKTTVTPMAPIPQMPTPGYGFRQWSLWSTSGNEHGSKLSATNTSTHHQSIWTSEVLIFIFPRLWMYLLAHFINVNTLYICIYQVFYSNICKYFITCSVKRTDFSTSSTGKGPCQSFLEGEWDLNYSEVTLQKLHHFLLLLNSIFWFLKKDRWSS